MAITRSDVLYTAKLSRLKLDEKEIELFTKQIGDIIAYVEKLNQLDLNGVEPTAHVLPVNNVLRKDEVVKTEPAEIVFKNAPECSDRLFMVPKIIE